MSIQEFEARFTKHQAPLPPWRNSWERGLKSLDKGFLKFLVGALQGIDPGGRQIMLGDATAYLTNQEKSGDLAVLEARWEDYQISQKRLATSPATPPQQEDDPAFDPSSPEAIQARAKIRQMLESLKQKNLIQSLNPENHEQPSSEPIQQPQPARRRNTNRPDPPGA